MPGWKPFHSENMLAIHLESLLLWLDLGKKETVRMAKKSNPTDILTKY